MQGDAMFWIALLLILLWPSLASGTFEADSVAVESAAAELAPDDRLEYLQEETASTVSLTTGVPPKIMVVTTAAGLPVPKKAITGIMNTNAGMVCMKSMIGWMNE